MSQRILCPLHTPHTHTLPCSTQVAQTLRARLQYASLKAANGWQSKTFDDLESDSQSSSAASSQQSSTSSQSQGQLSSYEDDLPSYASPETGIGGLGASGLGGGLGLGLSLPSSHTKPSYAGSAAPGRSVLAEPSAPHQQRVLNGIPAHTAKQQQSHSGSSTPRKPSSAAPEPNLYALIFGSALPQVAAARRNDAARPAHAPAPAAAAVPSTPPRARHVRAGSAARLHAIASSPQLGSPARTGGSGLLPPRWDPHNDPKPSVRAAEEAAAAQVQYIRTPTLGKPYASTGYAGSPVQPPNSHSRRPSGRLANGHEATSLAHDLGLVPGASRARPVGHPHPAFSPPRPPGPHRFADESHDQRETDRVAALLAAMADTRTSPAVSNARHSSGPSNNSSGAVTRPNGTFADPNSITPRRARTTTGYNVSSSRSVEASSPRLDESGERTRSSDTGAQDDGGEAAQLLLFLGSSPSPAGPSTTRARFPGTTPSLLSSSGEGAPAQAGEGARRFARAMQAASESETSEEDEAARKRVPSVARTLFGEELPSSQGSASSAGLAPAMDLTSERLDRGAAFAASPRKAFAGLTGSPPITPPTSERMRSDAPLAGPSSSRELNDASHESSAPHASPTHHSPRVGGSSGSGTTSSHAYSSSTEDDGAPITPPAPSSRPSTPAAPGPKTGTAAEAAFSMRDFLNVSPSPQPRSRLNSGRFTPLSAHLEGGVWLDGPNAWGGSERTPTRGVRSSAKFAAATAHVDEGAVLVFDEERLVPGPSPFLAAAGFTTPRIREIDDRDEHAPPSTPPPQKRRRVSLDGAHGEHA